MEALRPEPGREVLAWDNEPCGFGLRLRSTGAGSRIIQNRNSEGRSRRLTLGSSHVLTPDEPRGHSSRTERLSISAKLDLITPHVLRHTFASFASDLGFSELTVAALLGHAARGVTQRYVHLDQTVQLAAGRVCDKIAELLDG